MGAPRKGPKVLPAAVAERVRFYHRTHSVSQAAIQFDLSERRVRALVKGEGHPRGRRVKLLDPALRAAVERAWTDGQTKAEIAQSVGLNRQTVSRLLAELVPESNVGSASGERHWSWKGGRIINDDGYVLVIIPRSHQFYGSMRYPGKGPAYVLEHRLVMAEHLGRPLTPDETVHHIHGDRSDNRIEELELRVKPHGKGIVLTCRGCGSHDIIASPLAPDTVQHSLQQTDAVTM